MKTKLAAATNKSVQDALDLHARALYDNLGSKRWALVELLSSDRLQVADDEEKSPQVTVKIRVMEIALPEQEDLIRRALEALHTVRTARGTVTEDLDTQLAAQTLADCGTDLTAIEASQMRIAMTHWENQARNALLEHKLSAPALRDELRRIANGLDKAAKPGLLSI